MDITELTNSILETVKQLPHPERFKVVDVTWENIEQGEYVGHHPRLVPKVRVEWWHLSNWEDDSE